MYRIFVVEDEPLIRKGIVKYIQRNEAEGIEAVGDTGDGESACKEILESKPDLVITDICMPSMDGLELAAEVKKHLPDLKFIIISGFKKFEYAAEAIRIGVVEYLGKPIMEQELLSAIRRAREQSEKSRRNNGGAHAGNIPDPDAKDNEKIDVKGIDRRAIDRFLHTGNKKDIPDFLESFYEASGEEALNSYLFRQYLIIDVRMAVQDFLRSIGKEEQEFLLDGTEVQKACQTESNMRSVIKRLLEQCMDQRESPNSDPKGKIIEQAKILVEEHFREALSLGEVANRIGVSQSYLSRIFRQESGVTFVDYLNGQRMEEAKKLLRCTDKTIAEICYEVGYSDIHYFYSLFKKREGCTPKEWRNTWEV